jgi:hypothetical protein
VFDFHVWPRSAALMHLHSVLWYCVLLLALASVYRTLEPEWPLLTGLGLLLYAIDDAHGATVGWIANRNAIISAALSLPALAAHHRGTLATKGALLQRWLAPVWLVLGLCAGETAICVTGYLCAYALCHDRRGWLVRLLSLAPYALVLLAHRLVYKHFGLGSFGSSAYHDPLREPLAFAAMLAYNLPVLLSAELFVPMADAAFWGDVHGRAVLWCWSLLTLGALAWIMRDLLARDRTARFWALGMLLSAIPVSASLPGERLLVAVGIGAAPLLARVLAAAWGVAQVPLTQLVERGWQRQLAGVLVVLHVIVAPCVLPLRAYAFEPLARQMDRLDNAIPHTAAVRERTVVVLNAPLNIMLSYAQISRAVRGVPRPEHLYWLSSASSETEVTRVAADTLRVTQTAGFLLRPEETHYRADVYMPIGTRIERAGMHIEVVDSMPDGRPRSVLFRFDAPLEHARYAFYTYEAGELMPWKPCALAESVSLRAHDFFQLMAAEALR